MPNLSLIHGETMKLQLIKLLIIDILPLVTLQNSEMTSYLNNGYDVINCFAKV